MLGDHVLETSSTAGTGWLDLDGPLSAKYQSFFDVFGTGDFFYCVDASGAAEFEAGTATLASGSPHILKRTTPGVHYSTNSNDLVNFSAGDCFIYNAPPAYRLDVPHIGTGLPQYTFTGQLWLDTLR